MAIPYPAVAMRGLLCFLAAVVAVAAWCPGAAAQEFVNARAVGGVMVDPSGILQNADVAARGQLTRQIADALKAVPTGLDRPVSMRKISLKRLDAAIGEALAGGQLPDAILFLAGLQKIDYVVVSPEERDILLVGPGEGWTFSSKGAVVGAASGRPVMLLDDLAVALRSANAPTKSVISCSIDPTPEGLQRLRAHAATLHTIGNPGATAAGIEKSLGPQKISVTGVPETSHFARVMVAADYRMKRVSMNLEPSPVPGLVSFMQLMKSGGGAGMQNMLPRWWLAPDYEPPLRDEEGLVWQLRKASVKAMAENDFLDAAGVKHETGRTDPVSQRWADMMTDRYDDLAKAEPIFGELRNCMDLAVVSAILVGHRLPERAGLSLPHLLGPGGLEPAVLPAPTRVASEASLVDRGRSWTIACGGVQINPWHIASESETEGSLATLQTRIVLTNDASWWSN